MAILGSITVNELEILELDTAPTISGADAPIGSLGIVTDGSFLYLKTGAGTTNWTIVRPQLFEEFVFRITAANQTSTSVTYANITELTTPSLATGTYEVTAYIVCQSTATASGIGLRIAQGTSVINPVRVKWNIPQGGNGTDRDFQYDQIALGDNVTPTTAPAANTDFISTGLGVITLTTAGTVALQLRSETTTAVSVRIGSYLKLKKIG
jgi:hypothetical protein